MELESKKTNGEEIRRLTISVDPRLVARLGLDDRGVGPGDEDERVQRRQEKRVDAQFVGNLRENRGPFGNLAGRLLVRKLVVVGHRTSLRRRPG